jgi:hypothetical protein
MICQNPKLNILKIRIPVRVAAVRVFVVRHATLRTTGIREANSRSKNILQRQAKNDCQRSHCMRHEGQWIPFESAK